jgi:hypothetical protein
MNEGTPAGVRAGDCCEMCQKNYSNDRNWGLECPNCISALPNDEGYQISARYCRACLTSRSCPKCGAVLMNSIL